jgi:hypothetical protein
VLITDRLIVDTVLSEDNKFIYFLISYITFLIFSSWYVLNNTHIFLGAFTELRKATISFIMSVYPYGQLGSHWTNFHEFGIWEFKNNLPRKLQFHYKWTKITITIHEHQCTFLVISCSVILRIWNVSNKICREDQNTHFMFNNFISKNHTFHEIMLKKIWSQLGPGWQLWRIRITCWIP